MNRNSQQSNQRYRTARRNMPTRTNHGAAFAECRSLLQQLTALALVLLIGSRAQADPCGMVPPIYLEGAVPIERIGLQKTFVFYKNGVETFVIRPGFKGSVKEFGMLIPFPSPPALRKVSDDTFAHIAAAIDPPEVVVDLTPHPEYDYFVADGAMPAASMVSEERTLALDEVNVLKQEAVGMYEVAVLEAGSADALNRWMADHGYRYPDGMDDVCNDYVSDGWCFVAVKARVGQKNGVDPKPGMQATNSDLPDGATFDGHVQGMGFRFRSEELVVPMRLSAFNEGDLHNVVYLLTDKPMKARDLPAGHVVRQVAGADLLHNVTQPLPLRIIGGVYDDIPENRKQQLVHERNPTPHNGIAKDLFGGDLVAAATGKLSHQHEEREKELLDIGERLGLRGAEIDSLHDAALQSSRDELAQTALSDLTSMTMTVIDGDFEREVVAADNVYFTGFEMNPARNTVMRYNARLFGPSSEGAPGQTDAATPGAAGPSVVAVTHPAHGKLILQESPVASDGGRLWRVLAALAIVVALAAIVLVRRRGRKVVSVLLLSAFVADGYAQDVATEITSEQLVEMLAEFHESSDRSATVGRIKSLGESAAPALLSVVRSPGSIEQRGWAVVCLQEIGGPTVARGLTEIVGDQHLIPLVRTWAAAALIDKADGLDGLTQFATLSNQLPALRRPVRTKVLSLLQQVNGSADAERILRLCAADYQLQQAMAPVLLKLKPEQFISALMNSEDIETRRQAAAWLATLKSQNVEGVEQAVIAAVTFSNEAEEVPWGNGPLFIPAVNWDKPKSVQLINELTAWYVWCSANEQQEQISKITTNLNSRQLMSAAGFGQVPGTVTEWLTVWEAVIGKEAMEQLMKRTGFRFSPAKFERI